MCVFVWTLPIWICCQPIWLFKFALFCYFLFWYNFKLRGKSCKHITGNFPYNFYLALSFPSPSLSLSLSLSHTHAARKANPQRKRCDCQNSFCCLETRQDQRLLLSFWVKAGWHADMFSIFCQLVTIWVGRKIYFNPILSLIPCHELIFNIMP